MTIAIDKNTHSLPFASLPAGGRALWRVAHAHRSWLRHTILSCGGSATFLQPVNPTIKLQPNRSRIPRLFEKRIDRN